VQVVDFFARIVLTTLGVVFMLSVMTGMAVIGYAVCRDFQPTISMVSTMRLSGMKWWTGSRRCKKIKAIRNLLIRNQSVTWCAL
jgi:hypothetical protein